MNARSARLTRPKLLSSLLVSLGFLGVLHLSPAAELPGEQWALATPAEAGLDQSKLEVARAYALTGGGSGMIIRGGKLVFPGRTSNSRASDDLG